MVRCVVTITSDLMTRTNNQKAGSCRPSGLKAGLAVFLLLCLCSGSVKAAGPAVSPNSTATVADAANISRRYDVQSYVIEGRAALATNRLAPLLASHTGTNVSLDKIVRAAVDLQAEYCKQGFTAMNIVIAEKRITNGIVTMDIFPGAFAQIVVSGRCYWRSGQAEELAAIPSGAAAVSPAEPLQMRPVTNAVPPTPPPPIPPPPATPEQIAQAKAELLRQMATADFTVKPKDTRIHVVSTNAGPRFEVEKYLVNGNTVLTPGVMEKALGNIDGAFGTNVGFEGISNAVQELQGTYYERGYVTVSVGVPKQKLTNATVKLKVIEGRLVAIKVKGNQYFSSNNVMRALPSLHTNMVLNGLIFNAELNRANASRDRQIYPAISPGLDPDTKDLTLTIKDQLPLHGKVELNNQSSPGTPAIRLNASAVYGNLWQHENSLGFQYGFSPQDYKGGTQWNFYDQPLVANFSGFYRMPLVNPEAIEDVIASHSGSFGYDEATRKFNLPPPSGQPELNIFASRSTIDTGLETPPSSVLYNVTGVRQITQQNVQQDLTVNDDVGARLSAPLQVTGDFHSDYSGGFDYKYYSTTSYKTNIFQFTETTLNAQGIPNPPIVSSVNSPVPVTYRALNYLPLALSYNANWRLPSSTIALGLGMSGNAWYSGSLKNLQAISGSPKSTGHWVTLSPSFTWMFAIQTNWMTTLRADGQWTSEPLISNEQFGIGGINSVRGYQEGEEFGDTGWHGSLEQQTPSHLVGYVHGNIPLTIRGTVYMDGAREYRIDPRGQPGKMSLWGTGFGGVASIGPHWEARLLFSLPLLESPTTQPYQPYFNFALTAQF